MLSYLHVVRTRMLEDYVLDSCIAASAIVISVLRAFGIAARPLPVSLILQSPAFTNSLREDPDAKPKRGDQILLGSGRNDVPTNPIWPWHMTVIVPGSAMRLVDLSIDQMTAHMPSFNPRVVVASVSREFAEGRISIGVLVDDHAVTYTAYPKVQSYLPLVDWLGCAHQRQIANDSIALVRRELSR